MLGVGSNLTYLSLQDCDVMTYMRETCGCCGEAKIKFKKQRKQNTIAGSDGVSLPGSSPTLSPLCSALLSSLPVRLREALRRARHRVRHRQLRERRPDKLHPGEKLCYQHHQQDGLHGQRPSVAQRYKHTHIVLGVFSFSVLRSFR